MYKNTPWRDQIVDSETKEVIQEGTNQSAANFNNMEGGITDAHLALALSQLMIQKNQEDKIKVIEIPLNAKQSHNFNYPQMFTSENCVVISKMVKKEGIYQDMAEAQDSIKIILQSSQIIIQNTSDTDYESVKVVLVRF